MPRLSLKWCNRNLAWPGENKKQSVTRFWRWRVETTDAHHTTTKLVFTTFEGSKLKAQKWKLTFQSSYNLKVQSVKLKALSNPGVMVEAPTDHGRLSSTRQPVLCSYIWTEMQIPAFLFFFEEKLKCRWMDCWSEDFVDVQIPNLTGRNKMHDIPLQKQDGLLKW